MPGTSRAEAPTGPSQQKLDTAARDGRFSAAYRPCARRVVAVPASCAIQAHEPVTATVPVPKAQSTSGSCASATVSGAFPSSSSAATADPRVPAARCRTRPGPTASNFAHSRNTTTCFASRRRTATARVGPTRISEFRLAGRLCGSGGVPHARGCLYFRAAASGAAINPSAL